MPDMLVRLYDLPDLGATRAALEVSGIACRRAETFERSAVLGFVERHWPGWVDEATAAFGRVPPGVFIATAAGAGLIGFACVEATRPAFFGPTGVVEEWRGRGIGRVMLWQCLSVLAAAGHAYSVIGGVHGRESFYEEAVGAVVIPGSEPGIYRDHVTDPLAHPDHP